MLLIKLTFHTTGAVLALAMLATCYAAFTAIRADQSPQVTEEYRQSTLTSQSGNPFWELGSGFADVFAIVGERLSGK